MKKAFAIVMILTLLFVLTGCTASNVVGTWSNNVASKMTLELNSDKTFTYSDKIGISSINKYSGTYSVSGNEIVLQADHYEYIWLGYDDDAEPVVKESESSNKTFNAKYGEYEGTPCIEMDGYRYYK